MNNSTTNYTINLEHYTGRKAWYVVRFLGIPIGRARTHARALNKAITHLTVRRGII